MVSSMESLFSFLTLIITIFLFVVFLILSKLWNKNPKNPKIPRKTTPVKEPVKEGFGIDLKTMFNSPNPNDTSLNNPAYNSATSMGTTSTSNQIVRNYPLWSAPSYKFNETANDAYYLEFRDKHLLPSAEMIGQLQSMKVKPPELPDFGQTFSNFDADVDVIPWDSDNKDYVMKDVVWGYVSIEASKSIFLKVYHRVLLSDPANISSSENDSTNNYNLSYKSAVLNVSTDDPAEGLLYQATDAVVAEVGQSVLKQLKNTAYDKLFPGVRPGSTLAMLKANTERGIKLAKGQLLSAAEKVAQSEFDNLAGKKTLLKKVEKVLDKLGLLSKFKAGINAVKNFGLKMASKISALVSKFSTKFMPKFISKAFMCMATSTAAAGAATAAAIASAGTLAPFAIIINTVSAILDVISSMSMVIGIALSIILPTLFAKAFQNGSSCPQGKSLDLLIENETAYFFFTTFVPLGDLVDAFGPYCCVLDDGQIVFKTPFALPAYFYDTSLSISRHNYKPDKAPAPQSTTFRTDTDTLDKNEWKEVAGIYRKNCSAGTYTTSPVDALCNQKTYCPDVKVKKSSVPSTVAKGSRIPTTSAKDSYVTTYPKPGGYGGSCRGSDQDWYLVPLCTGNSCQSGYNFVAGVCWKACASNQIDVGALCRDKCNADEDEVAGICWKKCASNQIDVGALCRDKCSGETPHDEAGICWGQCAPNQQDWGALCRDECAKGFHDSGCCWGDELTYAREMKIPTATRVNNAGYLPPTDLAAHIRYQGINYCDFSADHMLDRMAQFYYNYSIQNPQTLNDGRISYEFIFMFFGVIASSELSCDVACSIKTVTYDPVTGGNYEETFGTSYPEDPGNSTSYRRFYFLKLPTDPQGTFTVTACTHVDYTAPDAQVYSGEQGVDPPISVPKIMNVIDKSTQPGQSFDSVTFASATAGAATSVLIGAVAGKVGGGRASVDVAGGLVGGMAAQAVSTAVTNAGGSSVGYGNFVENKVVGELLNGEMNYFVSTNTDNLQINFGPIYEKRAADKSGYVPDLKFCTKMRTNELQCSHHFIVRDTIDSYHTQNRNKRIKTLYEVEPRGTDGCYYKWSTVSYDPETNIEGKLATLEEVVHKFSIKDNSVCVYTPTFTFTTDLTNYLIRAYRDPFNQNFIYPTKNVINKATYSGRYIRIRPSLSASDGYMQISQIAVFDAIGNNISLGRPAFCTSLYSGTDGMAAPPGKVTDGNLNVLSTLMNTFQSSGSTSEYLDIDLGKNYFIYRIEYYGRRDSSNQSRNKDVRIQLLNTNEGNAKPVIELLTNTTESIQIIDFTTKVLETKTPDSPFNVPLPIPPDINLNSGCAARCRDRGVIDTLVSGYNLDPANTSSQIIRVLKAATPKESRCDYEVEMMRTTDGKKTVGKELISLQATLDTITPNSGYVNARYIRVRPNSNPSNTDPYLYVSQIVALNPAGTNIALDKKVHSTSQFFDTTNNVKSAEPSVIIDGTLTARSMPNVWKSGYGGQQLSSDILKTYAKEEYIEVDLGMSYPIQSVTYYGGSDNNNQGVRIQLLATGETYAVPIIEKTLGTNDRQQKVLFDKCVFKYAGVGTGNGSFIQANTPTLESIDTSGGVLSFQSITKNIINVISSIINPINLADPLGKLTSNVTKAQDTTTNTMYNIAAVQTLNGCPDVKCSDPAVLNAIMNSYNLNNIVKKDGVVETRKMIQVVKSGISSGNSCDVLFTELYEEYDDYLYPQVDLKKEVIAKRFTMANSGNCVIQVAAGENTVFDISSNAIGITLPTSVLPAPFTGNTCQVDCRDKTVLSNIKTMLNTTLQSPTVIPTFKSVIQSFPSAPNKCEFMMKKDVTRKSLGYGTFSTTTDLETYVEALFTMNPTTCDFTLKSVIEYDPDEITTKVNKLTNSIDTYLGGLKVEPPLLYNYDNTNPSTRVNETAQNL